MGYALEAACCCHMGKRRGNNEDNLYFDGKCLPEDHLGTDAPLTFRGTPGQGTWLAVFDGMGGENFGEQASFAAARRLIQVAQTPKPFLRSARTHVEEVSQALNLAVAEKARELMTSRMGTTLAGLYFARGQIFSVNVGDSRVYVLRGGTLTQVSEDHVSRRPLPPGRKAPLTQHLGMDPSEIRMVPSVRKLPVRTGDRYLICSDGLTDMVSEQDILAILTDHPDALSSVSALTGAALDAGGRDNITVIVCNLV